MIADPPPRKHGLERPFNYYQILSWLIFVGDLVLFVLFYIPPLSMQLRIVSSILVAIFQFLTGFYGYLCTACDPTDPAIYEELKAKEQGIPFTTNLKHFCTICNSHVRPRTKHCGQCNRCVDIFDHHCQWLNNCVGALNYRLFIKLIFSLFCLAIVRVSFSAYLVDQYSNNYETFTSNVQKVVKFDPTAKTTWILLIVSLSINGIVCILMMELLLLHLYLRKKKMTTYEYIVDQREKQARKNVQAAAAQQEPDRQVEPTKSKRSKVIIKLENLESAPNDLDNSSHKGSKDLSNGKLSAQFGELPEVPEGDDTNLVVANTSSRKRPTRPGSIILPMDKDSDKEKDKGRSSKGSINIRNYSTIDLETSENGGHSYKPAANPNTARKAAEMGLVEEEKSQNSVLYTLMETVKDRVILQNPIQKFILKNSGMIGNSPERLVFSPGFREMNQDPQIFKSKTNDFQGEISNSGMKMLNPQKNKELDRRSYIDIEDNRDATFTDERNSKLNKSTQENRKNTRNLQYAGKIKSNKIAPIQRTEGSEPDTFEASRITKINDCSVDISMNGSTGEIKLENQLGAMEYNKELVFKNMFH